MGGDIEEGHVGNLTKDQEEGLKEMWKKFFLVTKEKKPPMSGVSMKDGGDDGGDDGGGEGKEAFGGKATDDKAKDEQAKKNEKKELSAIMSKHGPEDFHKAFWEFCRGEHPDQLMLRFLRARKWDVDRGFAMMAGSLKFRIEFGVEEIRQKGEEGMCQEEGFQLQYDKGKAYIHGTDKKGRPIVFIHVAKHNPKEQSQKSLERFTIYNMETSKHLMAPPIEQGTLVFDMTGFGLSNMDWGCVAFIVKCFEAYYPETLGLCLIHKAPMVFNAIWKILRPMLDPVVREKIDFTNSEQDLMKHIDASHLSKGMGGSSPWKWRFDGVPEGENKRQEDKEEKEKRQKAWDEAVKQWEEVTEKWVNGDDSAGKERSEKVAKIVTIRHLDLDPYARGQTVYGRQGIYVGNGQTKWKFPGGDPEEEVWGKDADEYRKEFGIEGECIRYDQGEDIEVSDSDEDEDDGPPPGGKVGAIAVGTKKKASNSISKVTPGPSNAEKEKQKSEEKAARRKEKIEAKRKEMEEEKKKKEEEESKDEGEQEAEVNKGYQAYLDSIKSGVGSVASGAAAAPGKAAEYVPHEVGPEAFKIRLKNPPEENGAEGGAEGGESKEE